MCYSARILADYRKYQRMFGADISLREFIELFHEWYALESRLKLPRGLVIAAMSDPVLEPMVRARDARQVVELEQLIFQQRTRLADAQRKLQAKPTKAAADSARIAAGKVDWALGKLAELRRAEPVDEDLRIFPRHYAPVMVMEQGRRLVKPMRYQLRPAGKPALYDDKFPGTYNARRDSLEGYWKSQFGRTHAIVVADAFYENVPRHKAEGRELAPGEKPENLVLEFRPSTGEPMLIACLWSRWSAAGESELLSFAAITDEPPPEVAAAGHDRCVVPIRPEHVDDWLDPESKSSAELYAILDDRVQPSYEHRLAA